MLPEEAKGKEAQFFIVVPGEDGEETFIPLITYEAEGSE